MKGIKLFLFFLAFISVKLSAQSYLEFTANKGQWDNTIAFKANMASGAIVLKPDGGYRVALHNTDDLRAINDYYHHGIITHASASSSQNKAGILSAANDITANSPEGNNQPDFILHSHAYEVKFLNANPHPQIIAEKPLNTYNNYFIGSDSSKWASHCIVYQVITFKNIYPNIDIRYYTNGGQLKYDFIVNPGGNPDDISLYYDGVDGLKLKEGSLQIKTSVTDIRETLPYSYELLAKGRKETNCNYEVKGNIVRFQLDRKKEAQATLVIDPSPVFITFSGSAVDNWGYTATYDGAGNFYGGGIVFGEGFPTLNGVYQQHFQGGSTTTGEGAAFDIAIIKLDPTGKNRVYATYLGGSKGNEQPHSLVCDADGNLIIAGRTTSSDYPVTIINSKLGSGWDISISKLDPSGSKLIGSRIFSGSSDDGVNIRSKYGTATNGAISINRNYGDDGRSEVIVDASGNIYLASCTQSADFPVTPNAFQKTISTNPNSSFKQDGVIIKLTPDMNTVLLSSFLGGTGDDAAFVLAINPNDNNIYIAGGTSSSDFPAAANVYNGGIADGFVSIISNNNNPQLIKTTYYGTNGIDIIYGIQFDRFGFPYIMGTTTGAWPVTSNVNFVQTGGKQFISKLSSDLTAVIYSTVFGTNSNVPNISPTAFLVDRCQNVYVSGWGGNGNTRDNFPSAGTNGLSVVNSIGSGKTDGSDFYFFVLERDAKSQLYGDFFGQIDNVNKGPLQGGTYPDHVDGGTSRFDKNGVIYQAVCANCYGNTYFPTYPSGSNWSPINGTTQRDGTVSGCNLAAIKIAFNLAGVASGVQASINGKIRDTSGCSPIRVDFTDTIGVAKKYIWNFGDGGPDTTTIIPSASHFYGSPNNYTVRLVGVDSSKCNIYDTSYVIIRVRTDSVILKLNAGKVGTCNSLTYQFDNISQSVNPGKTFKPNSFKINYGDGKIDLIGAGSFLHTYAAPGSYKVSLVLIDTNFCNESDSIIIPIRLATVLKAQFNTAANGCAPYNAVFTNTSLGGIGFKWIWGDGKTDFTTNSDPATIIHSYPNINVYSVQLIATDTSTCNKTDTSAAFLIDVKGKPTAAFTASPQPPVANTPIVFTNNSTGAVSYKWFFGDGDSLSVNNNLSVNHIYNYTGTFTVTLIAINIAGCSDTLQQSIDAKVTPVFDVPNAFVPNCGCVNNKVYVKGYGISNIKWNIYNRWGTLVFTTTNKTTGWDGKYNGILQAQDVYHYILEIQLTNGANYIKEGDITLLR